MIRSRFQQRNSRAFSLIELLIVIGIILILMSLVIVAGKAVSNASRGRSTRAALETAKSMYSEYESATHLLRQPALPQGLYKNGTAQKCVASTINAPSATDFWLSTEDAVGGNVTGPPPSGLLTPDNPLMPKCDAVQNASVLMGMLYSIPANKKTLSNMPSSTFSNTIRTDTGNPLLLDGWGNPIIYVPAGGLINVTMGGANGAGGVVGIQTSTGFHPGTTYKATSLDRPFFASAGPDGDLSTGDDNIYSFN